jgi:uncharacterized membrane protein YccC
MTRTVTLEISEAAARQAQEVASRTDRRVEEVLVEWIDHIVAEPTVETLADDQVLALTNLRLGPEQQQELSELLADNREGSLSEPQRNRLTELMQVYRDGLVRKAQALRVAVARGLIAPLS